MNRDHERIDLHPDDYAPRTRGVSQHGSRSRSLRSVGLAVRGYGYLSLALSVALAMAGAMGFVLVSSVRHLLWLQMMPKNSSSLSSVWLWGTVVVSACVVVVFWYRLVRATVRWQQRRSRFDAHLRPHLAPLSFYLPIAVSSRTRWYQLEDSRSVAFTWGLLRPAIVLSTGLLESLDKEALVAVMHHEAAHARRYDPLQQSLLWVLSDAFGPFGMEALYRRYLVHREILADESALDAFGGDDVPLLSALVATVAGQGYPEAETWYAGLAGVVEARVEFLETGYAPHLFDTSMRNRLMTSALAVALTTLQAIVTWCH